MNVRRCSWPHGRHWPCPAMSRAELERLFPVGQHVRHIRDGSIGTVTAVPINGRPDHILANGHRMHVVHVTWQTGTCGVWPVPHSIYPINEDGSLSPLLDTDDREYLRIFMGIEPALAG
jgi:hypothetical protein